MKSRMTEEGQNSWHELYFLGLKLLLHSVDGEARSLFNLVYTVEFWCL